jgi:hypothetical protein
MTVLNILENPMNIIEKRTSLGKPWRAALCVLGLACATGAAQATIINISTLANSNSFVQIANGLTEVGTQLQLNAGDYLVTPVDTMHGGLYTAALRFGSVNPPDTGWEWDYYVAVNNGPAVKIGFGEGIPAIGGTYRSTAAEAFATAQPYTFALSGPANVAFYWRDNRFDDNSGGISISVDAVSAVPESSGLQMMALGAVLVLAATRRKTRPVKFI